MNYNQPEDFEPRETDQRAEEPTHYTNVWNSSMLWEVGLILLVGLVLVFCAWSFGAQGREVAATAQANTDMTWELSIECGRSPAASPTSTGCPLRIPRYFFWCHQTIRNRHRNGSGKARGVRPPRSSTWRSTVRHSSGFLLSMAAYAFREILAVADAKLPELCNIEV